MTLTEKRIAANRANAAKSSGPKTPEGKARSSRNATTHGLLASIVTLRNENPEAFNAFLQVYIDRIRPTDEIEFSILYQMAAATWRIRRSIEMETHLMDVGMENHPTAPSELDRTTSAFSDVAATPKMKLLHRYEVSFTQVNTRLLRQLNTFRTKYPTPDPEPETVTPEPEPQPAPAAAPVLTPKLRNEPTKSNPLTKTTPENEPIEPTLDDDYTFPTCDPFDPDDLK